MGRGFAIAFSGALCVLVVVASAAAKEGVVAKMVTPIPRDAEPGARMTVVWTCTSVDEGKKRPFTAEGVFIRLFGPGGARSVRVYATRRGPGRYRAAVRIPRDGVRKVVIGLMGWNDAGPAPVRFRVIGRVFR